jgi:hypothetical protein
MSSTRNKNTPGDYALEKRNHADFFQAQTYVNSSSGCAYTPYLAGNGLLPGKCPATTLSNNACDIESFLFGIGSTNLENPTGPVTAELKQIKSVNIIQKTPTLMPEPLIVESNQRPKLW